MKVLHINSVLNSGSTGRIVENICQNLLESGDDPLVGYGRINNQSQVPSFKISSSLGVYFHGVVSLFLDRHGFSPFNNTQNVLKEIIDFNPDIIHLHNIHGYYLNIQILFDFLNESKIPVVWTLHDCWAFTGHCTHYSYVGCSKWKTQCYKCPQIDQYPKSFIDNSEINFKEKKDLFSYSKSFFIVPVSKWLENEVKQSFLNQHHIIQINNGVNINEFVPKVVDKVIGGLNCSNKFVFLSVANGWMDRKGLYDLITFSQDLEENEVLFLVGPITEREKLRLKGFSHNVIFLNKTESIFELVNYYNIADCLLNFSIEETLGMVTIEALACGTPCIVYNQTAVPEPINEDIGFVVEPKDFQMIRLYSNLIKKNGKNYYSKKCRDHVIKNYNEYNQINAYKQLYNKILIDEN